MEMELELELELEIATVCPANQPHTQTPQRHPNDIISDITGMAHTHGTPHMAGR
jgi:hypothetical protein